MVNNTVASNLSVTNFKEGSEMLELTSVQFVTFTNKLKSFLAEGYFDLTKFLESFTKLEAEIECIKRMFWGADSHCVRHILQRKYSQELFNIMKKAKAVWDGELVNDQIFIFGLYEVQLLALAMYRTWSIPDTRLSNFASRVLFLATRLNILAIDFEEENGFHSSTTTSIFEEQLKGAEDIIAELKRTLEQY